MKAKGKEHDGEEEEEEEGEEEDPPPWFMAHDCTDPLECKHRWRLARKAYRTRDPEMSRIAHELDGAPELHKAEEGQYIKAAVFGGLDGIITTFAVVASVTGANFSHSVVIIMVCVCVNV